MSEDPVDWIKLGVEVGTGGPAVWIATGVMVILGLILWYFIKRAAAEKQDRANREQAGKDQAAGQQVGQAAENNATNGAATVDEVRVDNPDDMKQPLPPEPPQ